MQPTSVNYYLHLLLQDRPQTCDLAVNQKGMERWHELRVKNARCIEDNPIEPAEF